MDNKLKIGDSVMLKSETGPVLTVTASWENQCKCIWFNASNTIEEHTFSKDVLKCVNLATDAISALRDEMFRGSAPMSGKELDALYKCISKSSLSTPTLPNRL
jgi:uncharacterized protein YodC (DUF2158 family)